jgi:hypothetical protein
MPLKYMVLLKNYAVEHGIPQSRAVVELIKQAGLDEEVRNAEGENGGGKPGSGEPRTSGDLEGAA